MLRAVKRTLLWAGGTAGTAALLFGVLLIWPDPLFPHARGRETASAAKVTLAPGRNVRFGSRPSQCDVCVRRYRPGLGSFARVRIAS